MPFPVGSACCSHSQSALLVLFGAAAVTMEHLEPLHQHAYVSAHAGRC